MKPLLSFAVALTLISPGALPCQAGPNNNAKLLIHLARVDKVNICTYRLPSCQGIRTHATYFGNYHCPLLVTDGDAIAGVSEITCGIDYPAGLDGLFVSWFYCADLQFPMNGPNGPWPAPQSSIRIVWSSGTNCQRMEPGGVGTGVVAIAGSFYITSYSEPPGSASASVFLIPSPQTGLALVTSCEGVSDTVEGGYIHRNPSHLGYVTVSTSGAELGYSPCGLNTPVQPSTWSRIKASSR